MKHLGEQELWRNKRCLWRTTGFTCPSAPKIKASLLLVSLLGLSFHSATQDCLCQG